MEREERKSIKILRYLTFSIGADGGIAVGWHSLYGVHCIPNEKPQHILLHSHSCVSMVCCAIPEVCIESGLVFVLKNSLCYSK